MLLLFFSIIGIDICFPFINAWNMVYNVKPSARSHKLQYIRLREDTCIVYMTTHNARCAHIEMVKSICLKLIAFVSYHTDAFVYMSSSLCLLMHGTLDSILQLLFSTFHLWQIKSKWGYCKQYINETAIIKVTIRPLN